MTISHETLQQPKTIRNILLRINEVLQAGHGEVVVQIVNHHIVQYDHKVREKAEEK